MGEPDGSSNAKGFDPGWNDPPMFSYASRQDSGGTKKPSLTKRVGMSWESLPSTPTPPPASAVMENILPASARLQRTESAPPPPPCFLLKENYPVPSAPPFEDGQDNTLSTPVPSVCPTDGSNEQLVSVSSSLHELAVQLFVDKEREMAEITKRLSIMDILWKEDKFPDDVKKKLHQISQELTNGNPDMADRLQRELMVDHSPVCSSWMAAIRKLISERRTKESS